MGRYSFCAWIPSFHCWKLSHKQSTRYAIATFRRDRAKWELMVGVQLECVRYLKVSFRNVSREAILLLMQSRLFRTSTIVDNISNIIQSQYITLLRFSFDATKRTHNSFFVTWSQKVLLNLFKPWYSYKPGGEPNHITIFELTGAVIAVKHNSFFNEEPPPFFEEFQDKRTSLITMHQKFSRQTTVLPRN